MSIKDRIRKFLGVERIPLSPDAHEEIAASEEITQAVRHEARRNAKAQTELQLRSLDDIDHSNGIRLAIAGTLSQLQRDQRE
jgi:hypothetical protein